MYCPEGFTTLHEIFDIFKEYSWRNTPPSKDLHAERAARSETAAQGSEVSPAIDTGTPHDETEAYAKWLMLAFMHEYGEGIRIALPSGSVATVWRWVFALTHPVFKAEDWNDDTDYSSFPDQRKRRLNVMANLMPHIDETAFTIDCRRGNDRSIEAGLQLVHGCPLCVKMGLFPVNFELVDHLEGLLKAQRSDEQPSVLMARNDPRVASIIRLVEQSRVTRDQAKACLGNDLKAEEWRALWREAGRLRPDLRLNVPGPKGPRRS